MKPVIRVTTIESFRRYIEQSELSNYEITEQSVIESITSFTGNVKTRVGTAFHRIVEEGTPEYQKVDAGVRTFTYYNKPKEEPVPCGYSFDVDGYNVVLDKDQVKVALDYREQYPDVFHEVREFKDYGDCIVTGCADMLCTTEIRDIKTKYSLKFSDQDYVHSCQWRYYLELFGLDAFHFDLFIFDGYDETKHGYDVRGLRLFRHEPAITCYRYPTMEQDNRRLLTEFLRWAELRNLTQYLQFKED